MVLRAPSVPVERGKGGVPASQPKHAGSTARRMGGAARTCLQLCVFRVKIQLALEGDIAVVLVVLVDEARCSLARRRDKSGTARKVYADPKAVGVRVGGSRGGQCRGSRARTVTVGVISVLFRLLGRLPSELSPACLAPLRACFRELEPSFSFFRITSFFGCDTRSILLRLDMMVGATGSWINPGTHARTHGRRHAYAGKCAKKNRDGIKKEAEWSIELVHHGLFWLGNATVARSAPLPLAPSRSSHTHTPARAHGTPCGCAVPRKQASRPDSR